MSSYTELKIFINFSLTVIFFSLFITICFTWNSDVISGKEFKIDNATYRCEKTNELNVE